MPDSGDFTMTVHHQLYLYLNGSRDDYWITEGDVIHIYKVAPAAILQAHTTKVESTPDDYAYYEVGNYENVGIFPVYFLDPDNDYYEWLDHA